MRGVTLRLGVQAEAFVGDPTVTGVRLADGTILDADVVVAATGVKPHTEFLAGSAISTGWGIHVDDFLRTDVPSVVAAVSSHIPGSYLGIVSARRTKPLRLGYTS